MSVLDKLPKKLYYGIGEVSKAFDVNASLIRFWEKEFSSIKPKKHANGQRYFTTDDIKAIEIVFHLVKERGYTIEGAKAHLKTYKNEKPEHFDLIRKLTNIKEELTKLKNSL